MTRLEQRVSLGLCGPAILLAAGVLLRFPPGQHGFYPVCPVYAWTGLLCPGCGGTRALAALLRGHVAEAWRSNALVVGLIPLGIAYALVMARRVWRGDLRWVKAPAAVWIGIAVATVMFGVWRNA